MGYDMSWKREPAEVEEAYAVICANRPASSEDYQRWSEAQTKHGSYFRLNIFGMSHYRKYMTERGMLDNTTDSPPFPDRHAFGVTEAEYEQYPEDEAQMSPAFKAWRAAIDAWTEVSTGGLMPAYKFGSNDGWVVTPEEITNSLTALHRWEDQQRDLLGQSWVDPLAAEDDGYWLKWLRFLYCARGFGGVVVR